MPAVKKRIRISLEPQTLLSWQGVNTVCEESRCPNRAECSRDQVATFLIGGGLCTRNCGFCHVGHGKPRAMAELARSETASILAAVQKMGSQHVVITSVTRDDSEAELAAHFAGLTTNLRQNGTDVELLIPDFHGRAEYLSVIGQAGPQILAHNIETVRRISGSVRPQASYERSLNIFDFFSRHFPDIIRKSGFMVGLGESRQEIEETLHDLRQHGVEMVTIGQYLRPSPEQLPVARHYSEEEFSELRQLVQKTGFRAFAVGPFVRSSYLARETLARYLEQ